MPSLRQTLISLAQKFMATGNTVRRVVQMPVIRRLMDQQIGVAVDVGAGGGKYSCGMYTFGCLAERSHLVIALDPVGEFCETIIQKACDRGMNHIHSLRAIGEFLPLQNSCADLVLCIEVLTYMKDDVAGAQEIARILRPGGQAIISVPLPPEPAPVVGALREGYIPDKLTALLENVGLEIDQQEYCLYGLSRFALRADYPFWNATGRSLHLPILFLIYLERWLTHRGIRWGKPYDFLVRAVKPADVPSLAEEKENLA